MHCLIIPQDKNHLAGDGLALAAAVFSAVYTLIGREARKHMSTTVYTYIVYVFCALALCISTAVSGLSFTGYGAASVVVGLLLAVFSTLLGHSIFSWCLKFLSPSFVSASKLCEPVVAAVFAAILFAEIPAILAVAGGFVTIGGVLLYSREQRAQRIRWRLHLATAARVKNPAACGGVFDSRVESHSEAQEKR